jgi:uncharacterized protein YggT (Ycf19 family)
MWYRPPLDGDAPTVPDSAWRPVQPVLPTVQYVPPPIRMGPSTGARATQKVIQAIELVKDIAEALLILRIVLIFLAADPAAGFANVVYGLSSPLVAPFHGLFPEVVIAQGEVDLAAIIAMMAYALGARILRAVVQLIAHW